MVVSDVVAVSLLCWRDEREFVMDGQRGEGYGRSRVLKKPQQVNCGGWGGGFAVRECADVTGDADQDHEGGYGGGDGEDVGAEEEDEVGDGVVVEEGEDGEEEEDEGEECELGMGIG
ncbi:hypothetical protein HK104_004446 [Borealophlyctis nickersoniae]|nr:hypothetical protein HK104_004446 [Borealophlyctis nickersoniae]